MRVTLNKAGLDHLLRSPAGPVVKEITTRTRTTSNLAKRNVGVDTGRLRSSIQYTVNIHHDKVVGTVGSMVQYARYHHDGTGIHGPTGKPITPKSGKFLVFPSKQKGAGTGRGRGRGLVFATQVSGTKPNPFLVEALAAAVPYPIQMSTQR